MKFLTYMAHHIYRTQGIILRGYGEGESSKYLQVFTRELGLVGASVRSVRDAKSKLRYGLQDYSVSLVSLVRGKDVWRIINAVPASNAYLDLRTRPAYLSAAMRTLSLLRKLLAGEERHSELYDMVAESLRFLAGAEMSREELAAFQLLFALRALDFLGYAVREPHLAFSTEGGEWNLTSKKLVPHMDEARRAVEKALRATHLYQ